MSDELLSASGEAAWQSLRQHIEWTQGFWIGWVFTDHTPSVHELHHRIEEQLRAVGRSSVIEQPREPEELTAVLRGLLAGADDCDGCVTVAVVRQEERWQAAWDQFLLRLNERRELLRTVLRGGLLLCAPTKFKARSREAAPDLWSIRSLALDVAPVVHIGGGHSLPLREDVRDDGAGSPEAVTLALQAVAAAQRTGQLDAETNARIRAADALFALGRRDEGREQAVRAVEVAPTSTLRARAFVMLADIERMLEDFVAAERHYRAAIAADAVTSGSPAFGYLSQLLLMRGALEEAGSAAREALTLARARRERLGDQVEVLHNVAASLEKLGDALEAQGDWSGAEAAQREALALNRRIREIVGDTPDSLKGESISLARVGGLLQSQGDLSAARAVFEEGLALSRRFRAMVGDTEEALQEDVSSLLRLGDLLRGQGDRSGAGALYERGLVLSRQIRAMVGDTARTLRDVSLCLERVGIVLQSQGDSAGAAAVYAEGLMLSRQIRDIVGDTAEALRDVSLSLKCSGEVLRAQGDWSGAGAAFEEGLALARRLRGMVGDTVPVLEDLTLNLQCCAAVYVHQGKLVEARALLLEAVELLRRVQTRGQASTSTSITLAEVLTVLEALTGDEAAALRDPPAEP
jgi:tetratricopeptide (TPR) repeat protein